MQRLEELRSLTQKTAAELLTSTLLSWVPGLEIMGQTLICGVAPHMRDQAALS